MTTDAQQTSLPTDPEPAGDKPPKKPTPAKSTAKKAAADTKKTAPKAASTRRKKSTPRGGRPSKDQFRRLCSDTIDQLVGLLVLGGLTNERIAYDATVIQSQADALTDELFSRGWDATAGRTNRFGQWLERANTIGDWGRTASLIVGIGIPLAANHGLIPTETVGLVNLTRSEPLPMPAPVERKPKPAKTPPAAGDHGPPAPAGETEAEQLDRLGWPAAS